MDMMQTLSQELSVPRGQIESAVRLMDEGNTIPFIARYRKEATGGLDDTVLRNLSERLSYLRNLEKRRQEVFALVEESGKLEGKELEQLRAALEKAQMLSEIVWFIPEKSVTYEYPCTACRTCQRDWSGMSQYEKSNFERIRCRRHDWRPFLFWLVSQPPRRQLSKPTCLEGGETICR